MGFSNTDAFDDYGTLGVRSTFSTTDMTLMNALGHTVGPVVTAIDPTPDAGAGTLLTYNQALAVGH